MGLLDGIANLISDRDEVVSHCSISFSASMSSPHDADEKGEGDDEETLSNVFTHDGRTP